MKLPRPIETPKPRYVYSLINDIALIYSALHESTSRPPATGKPRSGPEIFV